MGYGGAGRGPAGVLCVLAFAALGPMRAGMADDPAEREPAARRGEATPLGGRARVALIDMFYPGDATFSSEADRADAPSGCDAIDVDGDGIPDPYCHGDLIALLIAHPGIDVVPYPVTNIRYAKRDIRRHLRQIAREAHTTRRVDAVLLPWESSTLVSSFGRPLQVWQAETYKAIVREWGLRDPAWRHNHDIIRTMEELVTMGVRVYTVAGNSGTGMVNTYSFAAGIVTVGGAEADAEGRWLSRNAFVTTVAQSVYRVRLIRDEAGLPVGYDVDEDGIVDVPIECVGAIKAQLTGAVARVEQEIDDTARARVHVQEDAVQLAELEEMLRGERRQHLVREVDPCRERLARGQPSHQLLHLVDGLAPVARVEHQAHAAVVLHHVDERAQSSRRIHEVMQDARGEHVVEVAEPERREIEQRGVDEPDVREAADLRAPARDGERGFGGVERDHAGALVRHIYGGVARATAGVEHAQHPAPAAPEDSVDARQVPEPRGPQLPPFVLGIAWRIGVVPVLLLHGGVDEAHGGTGMQGTRHATTRRGGPNAHECATPERREWEALARRRKEEPGNAVRSTRRIVAGWEAQGEKHEDPGTSSIPGPSDGCGGWI